MKLYHGTSKQALEGILKEGILPRKEGVGNWEKYPSSPKMVYLTVAYPFYFGLVHASKSEEIVVLEIDSDLLATSKLYPDEDYLSQVRSDIGNHHKYMKDIEKHKMEWSDSLEHLGNVSYKGIVSVEAITRYCIFRHRDRVSLTTMFLDPTICIMNYKFVGTKYKQMVEWMFGDREGLPMNEDFLRMEDLGGSVKKFLSIERKWKEAESKNRSGIVIVNVKKDLNHA